LTFKEVEERRVAIILRASRLRRDKSAYALARFQRDDGNWWRVKEPALTWVKFDLKKL
jgi:hypothetical protein